MGTIDTLNNLPPLTELDEDTAFVVTQPGQKDGKLPAVLGALTLPYQPSGGVARSVASKLGDVVAIHHPDQTGGELVIPQWATAICFYTRIDATSSRLSVTGF